MCARVCLRGCVHAVVRTEEDVRVVVFVCIFVVCEEWTAMRREIDEKGREEQGDQGCQIFHSRKGKIGKRREGREEREDRRRRGREFSG